jgi:alkylhydroperoxidase family enzyme
MVSEPLADRNYLRVTGRKRPQTPRIAPLRPDELDDQAKQLIEATGLGTATKLPTMLATLVRHPGLFRRWNPFGGKLIRGRLPARQRELLILRTTWLCGCDYLWESHVRAGFKVGLSVEEAERAAAGPDAGMWGELDRALLEAVDQLAADACIEDETWHVLAQHFDAQQLIEIPMLVGFYFLNTFAVNSLGIPLDEELFGHPPERDRPFTVQPSSTTGT